MKALIFSDPHIHNYKLFDKKGSRLSNCLKVIEDVFENADKHNCDYILCAGDLFDTQGLLTTSVINKTTKLFRQLFLKYQHIPFIIISGNHDNSSDVNNESVLEYLDLTFPNFILIDNQSKVLSTTESFWVYGVPYYQNMKLFHENLAKCTTPKDRTILLIHQTPSEISNKNIPADVDVNFFKDFKYVFCGHIHKPQQLRPNFLVIGSPLHRDLGDLGDTKFIYIYDTNDNSLKAINLKYPEFITTENDDFNYFVNNSKKQVSTITAADIANEEFQEAFAIDVALDIIIENYCSLEFSDTDFNDYLEIGLSILKS